MCSLTVLLVAQRVSGLVGSFVRLRLFIWLVDCLVAWLIV